MIRKTQSPKVSHVRVIFELPSCIWADRIYLTGDFNQWDETSTPMHQDRDGVWRAVIDLRANERFEFRYIIDGHWQSDNHADGFTSNEYGSENSVVVTTPPEPKALPDHFSSLVRENQPSRQSRALAKQRATRANYVPAPGYGSSNNQIGNAA